MPDTKEKPPLIQQEIARGSRVSQPVISTLMSDKVTRVDLMTLNGLCNFFGIQPGELFEYLPDDLLIKVRYES